MSREPGRDRSFRWPWRSESAIRDEVEEEIGFHLEMRAAELVREGVGEAEALLRARAEFGDVEEASRALHGDDERGERGRRRREWVAELAQDVRFALRALRRSPGFSVVAILTLALGVGANVTIFSVVDGVLLKRLAYHEPDRLLAVWGGMTRGEFLIARDQSRSFASLDMVQPSVGLGLSGDGTPERLVGARVTPGVFATLGVAPLLGRALRSGEERPGSAPVAVLSHGLWRQRFGGDPGLVGETVTLDGAPHTVVGVMPAEFRFPAAEVQAWVPLEIDPAEVGTLWGSWGGDVVGRLRTGATPTAAEREMRSLSLRMREANPLWTPAVDYRVGARILPLQQAVTGDVRPLLLVLLAAVGLVLLIACANVANLLLVRGVSREKEIAVRAALGASRGRVVRQLLTESLVLAAAGGALGVLLAAAAVPLLVSALPPDTPRIAEIGIDLRVLVFALATVLSTGIVFGVIPALRSARADLQKPLRESAPAGGAGRRRISTLLVVGQIALAMVLVTGAGLLARSLWNLLQVDPGFRAESVTAATLSPPPGRYDAPRAQLAFHAELLRRLEEEPGVESAAISSRLPFDAEPGGFAIFIEGVTADPNLLPTFDHRSVTPDFFRTLGIPLRGGRLLTAADREGTPLVALVDESAVLRFWPGEDPVGRRLRYPWRGAPWITVVGVVGNVRSNDLGGEQGPALYVPFAQHPAATASVVARTAAPPASLAASLRRIVARVDPDVPVSQVRTLREMIARSFARPRLATLLLGGFAALALLLGAVGVYGLIAYTVSQRTREMGVRIALGAHPRDIHRLVLRHALLLAAAGVAVGALASIIATRALASFLFQVAPADPATFVAVPLVLACVALLASWLPARRAMRVDPMRALRAD